MRITPIVVAAIAAVSFSACSKKQTLRAAVPQEILADAVMQDQDAESREAALRNKTYPPVGDMKTVYFDYDRYELSGTARASISENAAWLKKNPSFEVLIEGHCDERGTVPYNLSLGQKRAAAVRDYYKLLGIPARRIATLSYGNERPVCRESSEACWQRNRRAATLGRRMETALIPGADLVLTEAAAKGDAVQEF